eukprot:tig00000600_g2269.t1
MAPRRRLEEESETEDYAQPESQAGPSQPAQTKAGKRKRSPDDSSWSLRYFAKPPEGFVSGSVQGIRLSNFMCHKKVDTMFGPKMNYVTGANGSGKSAMATALIVCLGARANKTNRARSLKDFVLNKGGSNEIREAKVEVVLCNQGSNPFRQDEFGKHISIERTIRTNGQSDFCVTGENGQRTKGKDARRLVDAIVNHWDIQVGNPCVVMMQDQAKEFLQKTDEKSLFKFYTTAMQFDETRENYTKAQQMCEQYRAVLEDKRKTFPAMEKAVEEKRQVYEKLMELESMEEVIKRHKCELAWLHVAEEENKLAGLEEELGAAQIRVDGGQQALDSARANSAHLQEQYRALEPEADSRFQAERDATQAADAAYAAVADTTGTLNRAKSALSGKEKEVKRLEKELAAARRELDAARAKQSRDVESLRQAWQERVARLAQAEQEYSNEVEELKRAQQEMVDERNQAHKAVSDLAADVNRIDEAIRKARAAEETAIGAKGDRIEALARNMSRLVKLVEQRAGDFRQKPVGPIGKFVRLKDRRWAVAAEACVGQALRSFIVSNREDERRLMQLARQAGVDDQFISVITRRQGEDRYPERHLAANAPAPEQGAVTVASVLEVSHPSVFNMLVDSFRIESTWLFENADDAQKVAFAHRKDCSGVLMADGTSLSIRGMTEITKSHQRRTAINFFDENFDETIEEARRQMKKETQARADALSRKGEAERALKVVRDKFQALDHRIRDAERQMFQARYKREDEEKREPQQEEGSIADLEGNVAALEKRLSECSGELAAKQGEIEGMKQEAHAAAAAHKAAEDQKAEAQARLKEITDEVENLTKSIGKAERSVQKAECKLRDAEGALELAAQRVEAQRRQVADAEGQAAEMCHREDVDLEGKTPDSVARDIRRAEKHRQEEQQRRGGMSVEEAKEQYESARSKLATLQRQCDGAEDNLNELSRLLGKRIKQLEKMEETYADEINYIFGTCMELRPGCNGSVTFDQQNRTLEIKPVLPGRADQESTRDLKTLSGGERSFTTTAFTLAVGSKCQSPFRVMDEFDVFMDAQNRQITMDLLHKAHGTIEGGRKQFIFITPQDIASQVTEGVHVQKILHPRLQGTDSQMRMDDYVE